jgi:YVTN family beta-propeller protein
MSMTRLGQQNPFVGPVPFTENEKEWFFGRDEENEEIVSLILGHKLVLIYAESGAGKTSILNAQVCPTLKKNGFTVLPIARIGIASTIKVGTNANDNINSSKDQANIQNTYIFNALQSISSKTTINTNILDKSLTDFLNTYFPTEKDQRGRFIPQVLIFDQFEELFTFYPNTDRWSEEQEEFFDQIENALLNIPQLRIVFVIREDFLAQLDPFAPIVPEKFRPHYRLQRLRRESAILALEGPLRKAGLNLDGKIIQDIIDDLLKIRLEKYPVYQRNIEKEKVKETQKWWKVIRRGKYQNKHHNNDEDKFIELRGEFVEPIQLQLIGQRLWKKLVAGQISRIGPGNLGDLVDVDKALVEFYEEAVHDSANKLRLYEGDIRIWCEKNLITPTGTRSIIHRGDIWTSQMPTKVPDYLESRRILREEWRSGAKWYELTHDRLIKPIRKSNELWKNKLQSDLKVKRKKFNAKLGSMMAVAIIFTVLSGYFLYHLATVNQTIAKINVIGLQSPVDTAPTAIAVDRSTHMVYVANLHDDSVSVINEASNTIIGNGTLGVGTSPIGITVDPSTHMVYVANLDDNSVSVINGTSNTIIGNGALGVGTKPTAIAVDPSTHMVYVANLHDDSVSVINGTSNTIIGNGTLGVGTSPIGIAVDPSTHMVYVANFHDDSVSVINGTSNTIIGNGTLGVGTSPIGITVDPSTHMVYVANRDDNSVSVINGTLSMIRAIENNDQSRALVGKTPVDRNPRAITVDPSTHMVYAANRDDNSVSVINGKGFMPKS